MINALLIGNKITTEKYSTLLSKNKYFSNIDFWHLDNDILTKVPANVNHYDAVFLCSDIQNINIVLPELLMKSCNIYLVDQPQITSKYCNTLNQLSSESQGFVFTELPLLFHPLVVDFINSNGSTLLYRFNQTIISKARLRNVLFSALSLLVLLSPTPAKKMDVITETSTEGWPMLKVKLKMFDSSMGYVFIKFGKKDEHSISIESRYGNFIFNFIENYLENIHGSRFESKVKTSDELILENINAFALSIILKKAPHFTFSHYIETIRLLHKIEDIST